LDLEFNLEFDSEGDGVSEDDLGFGNEYQFKIGPS